MALSSRQVDASAATASICSTASPYFWNLIDLKRPKWDGPALSPGRHTISSTLNMTALVWKTLLYNNMSGLGGLGTVRSKGKALSWY
jgi:arylsulfatase